MHKTENEISYLIRGAIFDVYNTFGPGLYESVYVAALSHYLREKGCKIRTEVPVAATYNGVDLGLGFKMDILVDEKVIIEVKSTDRFSEVHHKQILTYLRLSGLKLGILVNFNVDNINEGIFRKVNNL